ncbi:MAG: hypothetical protein WC867_00150 [Candidatus Pacearchaeota archaeon]|jgi:hypothetical protein
MKDITRYLTQDKFTKPKGTNAFINNNLDELYKLFQEIVAKEGVLNLRFIGDSIAKLYEDYDSSEARTRLYKATDIASQNYGLNSINLENALKIAYPDLEGFQIINGISKAGRGQINLTRFLYKEEPRLTEFILSYSEKVKFNDKKFPVINVEKMFK